MDDFDEADLDGDGEFDAIDMSILEDEEERKPVQAGTGCAVLLFGVGSSLGVMWWMISDFIS